MIIAIHHRHGSFSDHWIEYLKNQNIPYKIVDAYHNDILEQLHECDGFMWHWDHGNYKDLLFAKQLTLSLESMGKHVFPSVNTGWHFDDKVGQKYLFEVKGIKTPKSYIFYDEKSALDWASNTSYPKIFKLRGGAGSMNVIKIGKYSDAKRLIRKAFGKGFRLIDRKSLLVDALNNFRKKRSINNCTRLIKCLTRNVLESKEANLLPYQKGYVYFQDFLSGNNFDERMIVIGKRCFCIRRHCRENDFRASGSGVISYDHKYFDIRNIKYAFELATKLESQSLAVDFIYDVDGDANVVEISFGFINEIYQSCEGYWDAELCWHDRAVNPSVFIIEDFIRQLNLTS